MNKDMGVPGRLNDLLKVIELMKEKAKPPSWTFDSEPIMLTTKQSHQYVQSAKSDDLRGFSTVEISLWSHDLSLL